MELRDAVVSGKSCRGFRTLPLASRGLPEYVLALRDGRSLATALAVARAVRCWRLGSKTAFVLELVCQGQSNKEIAQALGCAEVTVERHLTQLFRAGDVRSRAELAARIHRL